LARFIDWLGRGDLVFVAPWPSENVSDWLNENSIDYQCLNFTVGDPCDGGTAFVLADDHNALLFRLWADDDKIEGPIRFNVVSDSHEQEDPFALRAPARGRSSRNED
jgi:hypothetical protein